MPKIIWQRYHVLHTGSQAYTRQKIWVTLVTKPATKRGNLRGSPLRQQKKGKQMARWGSRYLQLPQVTCSVSFLLFLSLSLYPLFVPAYIRFVPPLICGRCKFGQSSVQSQPVVSLLFRSVALTDLLCTPAVPQPQVGGPSLLLVFC